jgi:hypothetical protein
MSANGPGRKTFARQPPRELGRPPDARRDSPRMKGTSGLASDVARTRAKTKQDTPGRPAASLHSPNSRRMPAHGAGERRAPLLSAQPRETRRCVGMRVWSRMQDRGEAAAIAGGDPNCDSRTLAPNQRSLVHAEAGLRPQARNNGSCITTVSGVREMLACRRIKLIEFGARPPAPSPGSVLASCGPGPRGLSGASDRRDTP